MPPIPGWDGLHPLIIHFPIALLLTVPVLLLLALVIPRHTQGLAVAGFALMLMGTIASLVSISTGEAAAELVDQTPALNAVIEQHEELAEQVRIVFIVLTVIFATLLWLPKLMRKPLGKTVWSGSLAVLVLLTMGGNLLIANTAHQGGRLVHEFGVHSIMAPSGAVPATEGDFEENED